MDSKRKIKICLIFICTLFYCNYSTCQSCIVETYSSQIGIREATGHNDGSVVEEYLATCNLGKGNAWCAAFVNWSFTKCCIETGVKTPAWSPSWFTRSNLIFRKDTSRASVSATAGDVFGIYFANKGRIAHVGFIDNWTDSEKFCITVEGNTNEAGSREGDGVYRKRRLKTQIYAISRYIK